MNNLGEFINSFLPDNIPKRKRQQLYDEMEGHLLDRADFYTEIGYDRETALRKSMECFGQEKEIKDSVKADLYGLYHERFYYAVLAGLIPLILNFIALFTGNYVLSFDSLPTLDAVGVFMSALSVCFLILQTVFCYKKGYRKSLIATGISNLLIGCSYVFACYPQSSLYALLLNTSYALEKLTPLLTRNAVVYWIDILAWCGSLALLSVTAVISFILAKRIKRKGISERKPLKGLAVTALIMCCVCFLSCAVYGSADRYFSQYIRWFDNENVTPDEEALAAFEAIALDGNYDEAGKQLGLLGYISTEDYMSTLTASERKMFRYSLKELDFFFGDEYTAFFKTNKSGYNSFIFLRADEKGLITGKGIGVGSEYEDEYGSKRHYCSTDESSEECTANFEGLKKGDRQEEVLRKLTEGKGHFYTVFSEKEDGVQKDYYRIHSQEKADSVYYFDTDIYIQLWFTDGLLEKAHFETTDYNHGGKEIIKTVT